MVASIFVTSVNAAKGQEGSPPSVDGEYKPSTGKRGRGPGSATVKADTVTLRLPVASDAGKAGLLIAPNLTIVNGRFSGKGQLDGVDAEVSGRVDPAAGGVLLVPRIVITARTGDGQLFRAGGARVTAVGGS